jgi:putative ABC transport system permease protein
MLSRLLASLRGLARRRRADAEAGEELQFHLEQEAAANVARGMTPVEARRAAHRDLGGAVQTAEAVRDVRTVWLDALWRDVWHAARALSRTPGFSAVALILLSLSIGASTAIFSIVDGVMFRPLPFDESHRLVSVFERRLTDDTMAAWNPVAPQNFLDWRAQQDVFTGLAALAYGGIPLRREGRNEPESLLSRQVTAEFFSILRTHPLAGRFFTAENEVQGRHAVAVISHGLWHRRFGGTPDAIGARLPGQLGEFEVVGVLPPSFDFPVEGETGPIDVWVPLVVPDDQRVRGTDYGYYLQVIGRLRDGVSIPQAQTRMDHITAGLAATTPSWFEDRVAAVEPLRGYLARGVRSWMYLLLAAVGGVLLVACVNLASLMMVRMEARRQELAVRTALGASRWTLARALLVESVLLSAVGAVAGLFLAWIGVEILRAAIPAEVPRVASIAIDLRVLTALGLTALLTGVAFGTAPALLFTRPSVRGALTDRGRGSSAGVGHQRLGSTLVIAEVALASGLLVGAGLFLASFARVTSVDLGVGHRDVLTVRIRPFVGQHNAAEARANNPGRLQRVLEQVQAIPGVERAALVNGGLPFRGDLITDQFLNPNGGPSGQDIDINDVSPEYFTTIGVPLLSGRFFDAADRQGTEPVVIINRAAAERHFGATDPIGRTVQFLGTRRVVGVVGNIRHDGPESDWRRQGYVPIGQGRAVGATLVLRTALNTAAVLPAIKDAIWSEFPDVPLPQIQTFNQYLSGLTAQRRFTMLLMGLFGLIGLLIAGVGMYGVMAHVVAQRVREIGIRMALGAVPTAILRSVLGRSATCLIAGLAIGLIGTATASPLVEGFLFQVDTRDPMVFAGVCVVLAASGLLAAIVPARRAARVDPVIAMRAE